MSKHNRWCTPTVTEINWDIEALPVFVDRTMIDAALREGLAPKNGVTIAAIGCTPVEIVTEINNDPEPVRYWMAHVLFVDTVASAAVRRLIATKVTSLGMVNPDEDAQAARIDFLSHVVRFAAACMGEEVSDAPAH